MKIWVCRDDSAGVYTLYEEKCNPVKDVEFGEGCWECQCEKIHTISGEDGFCAPLFKRYTGIKHIRKGTRKLMEWRKPLE